MPITVADLATVVRLFRANLASILTAGVPNVTVLDGHPVRIEPGALPAVMIDMVTIRRIDPDEGDSQLGSRDWHLEVPIEIYVDATTDVQNPAVASALAEQLAANVIALIDGNPTLSNWGVSGLYSGVEAVIQEAVPFIGALNGTDTPVLGYEAQLHAFLLLPQT